MESLNQTNTELAVGGLARTVGGAESKRVTPSERREAVRIMAEEYALSITRSCAVAKLSRAAYYPVAVRFGAARRRGNYCAE
jgi:hypothetical protein